MSEHKADYDRTRRKAARQGYKLAVATPKGAPETLYVLVDPDSNTVAIAAGDGLSLDDIEAILDEGE